jgi:hypothetical protein
MEILLNKNQITRVCGSMRWLFRAPEKTRRRERNRNALHFMNDYILGSLVVFDSARRLHQIDNHFITNTDGAIAVSSSSEIRIFQALR